MFCLAAVVWGATDAQNRQLDRQKQSEPAASISTRRVALVIGNSAYVAAPLVNPVNDARAIAGALRSLGFEVAIGENLSQVQMKRSILAFGEKLKGGSVGLFYYAGHGVQTGGRNYLIPVDAAIEKESDI